MPSSKKQLTPEELRECETLRTIWNEKKKKLGLTAQSIADQVEKSAASINHYLNGVNRLNAPIASVFASALQVSVAAFSPRLAREIQIMSEALSAPDEASNSQKYGPGTNRVPLISMVQAGEMCETVSPYQDGGYEELVEVHVPVTEGMYALKVSGNSMTQPTGVPSFPEGMTIVVDPHKRAENGSLVIACDGDGKATFKKLRFDGDMILLEPLNPNFEPMRIKKELRVCGVVVEGFFKCA